MDFLRRIFNRWSKWKDGIPPIMESGYIYEMHTINGKVIKWRKRRDKKGKISKQISWENNGWSKSRSI